MQGSHGGGTRGLAKAHFARGRTASLAAMPSDHAAGGAVKKVEGGLLHL